MNIRVSCPTCQAPVTWDQNSPWRPFCSERCRLIDLGEWLDESRRIPADEPLQMPDTTDGSELSHSEFTKAH